MKKLLLSFVLILLISFKVSAQEESQGFKGAWWGLAAGSFTDSEASDTQTLVLLPAVGYFVSPTVTVGTAVGLVNNKVGSADATNTIVVKPLARKYWGVTEKFFSFGEANVPLIFGENSTGYGFNIEPGIDYFIGGKWTIEAKFGRFGYNSVKPDGGDAKGTTTLGFNMFDAQTQEGLGSGMSIGLKYIF